LRTFVALFVVSAAFGLAIGAAYWSVSREMAGTSLLAVMTTALCFAAAYAVVAERDARLAGDQPQPAESARTGEDLGIFTKYSHWPILIACCSLGALTGVLWSPFLAVASIVALVACLWHLGSESARI
jgi:Flp pilus assembly protein TadB